MAAGEGSKDALECLLALRADVTARDVEEWTAHHYASYRGQRESLEILLKHAACPSSEPWALTPLHLAAAQGHADCVQLLLQHGAYSPNTSAPLSWRPAQLQQVMHADPQEVGFQKVLLEQLGRSKASQPLGGLTALHLASAFGHLACVETLLQASGDPNASTENHLTALLLCVKKWHLPLGKPKNLGAKRLRGQYQEHEGVFGALLSAGASDDIPAGRETGLHAVAFHWAAVDPSLAKKVGSKLLDSANSNIHARAEKGGTPLHWAVNGRNWALCSLLLERRADPSIQNDVGRSVWDLPVLKEEGQWQNADRKLCCQTLLNLR